MTKRQREIEKILMLELLQMAETSRQYEEGVQWAINAVATARMILGQVRPARKPLFITESANEGITVKSLEFLKKNLSRLGPITKVRGYKDDDLDYWIEFSDQERNTIRASGFSWGYGGEGPNGLARACELIEFPLNILQIASMGTDENWERTKV